MRWLEINHRIVAYEPRLHQISPFNHEVSERSQNKLLISKCPQGGLLVLLCNLQLSETDVFFCRSYFSIIEERGKWSGWTRWIEETSTPTESLARKNRLWDGALSWYASSTELSSIYTTTVRCPWIPKGDKDLVSMIEPEESVYLPT